MNIKMLVDPNLNYLTDIIYHGFRTLGHYVVEEPYKPSYHGGLEALIPKYKSLIFNFSCLEPLSSYDLVLADIRYPHNVTEDFCALDGEDHQSISKFYNDFNCQIYFKRELTYQLLDQFPKCRPLTLAAIDYQFVEEKSIPFCFYLSNTNYGRQEIFDVIRQITNQYNDCLIGFSNQSDCALTYEDYCDVLKRSRSSISYPGVGQDTYRYWEIPANGCALISKRLDIIIPNDFDASEMIEFSNSSSLLDRLQYYVKDHPDELENIRRRGYEKLVNYHTSIKRAQQMLDEIML